MKRRYVPSFLAELQTSKNLVEKSFGVFLGTVGGLLPFSLEEIKVFPCSFHNSFMINFPTCETLQKRKITTEIVSDQTSYPKFKREIFFRIFERNMKVARNLSKIRK